MPNFTVALGISVPALGANLPASAFATVLETGSLSSPHAASNAGTDTRAEVAVARRKNLRRDMPWRTSEVTWAGLLQQQRGGCRILGSNGPTSKGRGVQNR